MTQDMEEMLDDIASCHPEAAKEFRRLQGVEEAAKKVLLVDSEYDIIGYAHAVLWKRLYSGSVQEILTNEKLGG